jgi:hypothetical protein
VTNGQTAAGSVMVTNTGTADLSITNTSSSNGLFTVTPHTATLAPAASRHFLITFAPVALTRTMILMR